MTVMVTACPHALGVAIPLVIAISTGLSATHGLLIRNRTAFESARNLNTIIFDKTGTLTKGSHEVQQIIALNSYSADELLKYAASVQQNSEHHIAHGLTRKAKEKSLQLWPVENFSYIQGVGVKGTVNGKLVISAGPNYFKQNNQPVPATPSSVDLSVETINYLLIDNKPTGIFTLADSIRESSAEAIADLKQMNIKSYLLTGDNEDIAKSVAGKLKMDGYFANVLPHEKQEKLKEFQSKGELVAMTGDGVNDAPALAQADIGIAIGTGTDVAIEASDITLIKGDLRGVVHGIALSKATLTTIKQNLFWAFIYNMIGIPIAAGVLYPMTGWLLSPILASAAMSLSSVSVVVNSLRLRRFSRPNLGEQR